jgi:hypothetical protein
MVVFGMAIRNVPDHRGLKAINHSGLKSWTKTLQGIKEPSANLNYKAGKY